MFRAMPEYHAILRSLRQSPRKVRLLAGPLVGLSVPEARARLSVSVRAPAGPLLKLLESAAANALDQGQIGPEDLLLSRFCVNAGSTLKRFRPRAFGRAAPIRRRSCHCELTLKSVPGAKKRAITRATAAAATATSKPVKEPADHSLGEKFARPESQASQKKAEPIVPPKKQVGFMRRFFQRKSGM